MKIAIIGSGISGLSTAKAIENEYNNITIHLFEKTPYYSSSTASWLAGGMLAPWCEFALSQNPTIKSLGIESLTLWKNWLPNITKKGSLVISDNQMPEEINHFSKKTTNYQIINEKDLHQIEPSLTRFKQALLFKEECHLIPRNALVTLEKSLCNTIVHRNVTFLEENNHQHFDWIIDCSGMAAKPKLTDLRAVKGDMCLIYNPFIEIHRPIRFLHLRYGLYIVPWDNHHFMIGGSQTETQQSGITLSSLTHFINGLHLINPDFHHSELIESHSGFRPTFPNHCPQIHIKSNRIWLNGMFRHGFLTAPALGKRIAHYLKNRIIDKDYMYVTNTQ